MNISEVENLGVDGVVTRDYPDFCDAYFSEGWHIKENRELTEDELIQIGEDYPDVLNEMAYESLI
jgi:benzoyl-CoA reductase/2-hydroxyglutaryl-CoA dehydratase subunit BcrC/BadD/HgdB